MSSSSSVVNEHHCGHEGNNIDPDKGNTWLCSACKLPIFATPYTGGDGGGPLLHDQCGNLPEELKECEVHPQKPLFLRDNKGEEINCSECSEKCGSKLYSCGDPKCDVVLDVACALPLKILHRSHPHRLLSLRTSSFGTCGVCGITHQRAPVGRSYICRLCGFWIHPECATSPNVIEHEKHEHPLVLYYDVGAAFGAHYSTPLHFLSLASPPKSQQNMNDKRRMCVICEKHVRTGVGIYACIMCRQYILHIYCAKSDPATFKPVLGEEARFPNLVRLPMADEHESLVRHVTLLDEEEMMRFAPYGKEYSTEFVHGVLNGIHVFILHQDKDKDEDGDVRVCEACLKMITTPPYYSCSICPNFYLHDYCYRLPVVLSANPTHAPNHILIYKPSDYYRNFRKSICAHCRCLFTRAFYTCSVCKRNFDLDVQCAIMPGVVTHEAHSSGHFLLLSDSCRGLCYCCGRSLEKQLGYECRTCSKFSLHTWCAMLPKTVTHKFDPHPLLLMNTPINGDICEICEKGVEEGVWCYRCHRCDQSFHVDCIPCLDMLYKIRSLITTTSDDGGGRRPPPPYNIPTRLIRGLTLHGHGHDYCTDIADEYDDILQSH